MCCHQAYAHRPLLRGSTAAPLVVAEGALSDQEHGIGQKQAAIVPEASEDRVIQEVNDLAAAHGLYAEKERVG